MYVVARDFGFAPNPFHGICTLTTCMPRIRSVAKEFDWVIGMGGGRLKSTGKCIFAMKVSRAITFNEYWTNSSYQDKRPVRNGSLKMIVGDNIYHQSHGEWQQLDSHHSHPDGSPNTHNITKDTGSDAVLVSDHFFYFGAAAVEVPKPILQRMGYKNWRGHRTFESAAAQPLISFIETNFSLNRLLADPFDFEAAGSRYSVKDNKITAHD